jgi:hypothetical protein
MKYAIIFKDISCLRRIAFKSGERHATLDKVHVDFGTQLHAVLELVLVV